MLRTRASRREMQAAKAQRHVASTLRNSMVWMSAVSSTFNWRSIAWAADIDGHSTGLTRWRCMVPIHARSGESARLEDAT